MLFRSSGGSETPTISSTVTGKVYYFKAVASGTFTLRISRSTANGNTISVNVDNVSIRQIGEVAAYTPQSIDTQHSSSANHKWLDTTSNANHGSVSGAVSVGDNDHRGLMRIYGNSIYDPTYAVPNYSGTIQLGNNSNWCGRLEYSASGVTELRLDNSYNSTNAKTTLGMKTAGTRLPVMELVGDGSVKATSAASDNLFQVGRGNKATITVGTTNAANGNTKTIWNIHHQLGTDDVVVSVREANASVGSRTHVETNVHVGEYYATSTWTAHVDYAAIEFASAPADNTVFNVTVIGI